MATKLYLGIRGCDVHNSGGAVSTALFGIPADTSVAFAEPRTDRRVAGSDIAKTVARRATEAERWRYGVELRIIGSRWRPQTRAPHYPAPEPYVYRRKAQPLTWTPYQLGGLSQATKYEAWMADRDKPKAGTDSVTAAPGASPEPRFDSAPSPNLNVVAFPSPVREVPAPGIYLVPDRKAAAAELLREIAPNYGPRRAHKLRAMADFLEGKPAVSKTSTGG